MNLVDSCGWLECIAGGPNMGTFRDVLRKPDNLIVPTVCIYEVLRRRLPQLGRRAALEAVAVMRAAPLVVPLTDTIAVGAAVISERLKLPMADSMILATAREYNALIWTQDRHFEGLPDVNFIRCSDESR